MCPESSQMFTLISIVDAGMNHRQRTKLSHGRHFTIGKVKKNLHPMSGSDLNPMVPS